MATLSDPPQGSPSSSDGFNLSMLVNDTRYRGYTFQIIAFMSIAILFWWLGFNAVRNLEALGQDISWAFLGQPAGYDIRAPLIEYNSQSTHFRAAMVGVLNTLMVAILGCILATIVGVIAGVLRLSNNWLIAKLMAFYVEAFRNVPVLIWILIVFNVLANSLPAPRAFRGENPDAEMLFGAFAFTNRGVYIPWPQLQVGGEIVVGVFLASLVAIWAFRRYALKLLYETGKLLPTGWISLGLFFGPTLVVFAVLAMISGAPITLDYPELRGFNFQGGQILLGPMLALWLALSLYTGAFIAENVRAGIMAISKGQTEAAASLGLRPNRTMSLVILPQALRVIIPPLISQYLNLTKNSSLAAAVGFADLTGTLGGVTLNQTGRSFEAVTLLMLFYLLISLAISAVMNVYNNSVKLKER